MKENQSEKLYLHLSDIDEDLLREASDTDTRAKLLSEVRPDTVIKCKTRNRSAIIKTVSALAACLVLVLTMSTLLPLVGRNVPPPVGTEPDASESDGTDPDGSETGGHDNQPSIIRIDSLDAFNYYTAKVLAAQNSDTVCGNPGFVMLNSVSASSPARYIFSDDKKSEADSGADIGSGSEEDHGWSNIYEGNDSILYDEEKEYYYYEFDPNEPFTVYEVIGFRIMLTDPDGFLAQRLGTGIIDVVMTRNSFESMITFHAQDGRFFSCLGCESGDGSLGFINQKYIDGFRIVKNLNWTMFRFDVKIQNGHASGFSCAYYEDSLTGDETPLDIVEFVEGSDYVVQVGGTFTASEIEILAAALIIGD